MIIHENLMKGYTIKKNKNGQLLVCKILNVYDEDEMDLVIEVLSKLATSQITEEELLKETRIFRELI